MFYCCKGTFHLLTSGSYHYTRRTHVLFIWELYWWSVIYSFSVQSIFPPVHFLYLNLELNYGGRVGSPLLIQSSHHWGDERPLLQSCDVVSSFSFYDNLARRSIFSLLYKQSCSHHTTPTLLASLHPLQLHLCPAVLQQLFHFLYHKGDCS